MTALRHDWHRAEIRALFDLPFNDLLLKHKRCIVSILMPMRYKLARCCQLKQARVPKTVNTVRSQVIMTQA